MPAEKDRRAAAGKRQGGYSRVMLIRVLGTESGEPWGDIVHPNLNQPVRYHSVAGLSLLIERIARLLNLPGRKEEACPPADDSGGKMGILAKEYQDAESPFQAARPERIQLAVCVELIGGHYMSLQGRIWGGATGGRYRYFRSELELLEMFSRLQQSQCKDGWEDGRYKKSRGQRAERKKKEDANNGFREEAAARKARG